MARWNVLVGLLVSLVAAALLVRAQFERELRAMGERAESVGEEGEPFFPEVDPRAEQIVGAIRTLLEGEVAQLVARLESDVEAGKDSAEDKEHGGSAQPVAPTPSEALQAARERFPKAFSGEAAERWVVSLYVPRPGLREDHPDEQGPWVEDLSDGLKEAFIRIWDRLPGVVKDDELPNKARIKVDYILPGERLFPEDGGYRGVALDEGLDGIVLRHPDQDEPFHYLPSWTIERPVGRGKMHGRARYRARQMAGWKKRQSKEASHAAFRTRAWVEGSPGGELVGATRANTDLPEITPRLLRERIGLATAYLVRETDERGEITYDYQPVEDKKDGGYNIMRHAGTAYSMMQGYRLDPRPETLEAVKRAVKYYRRKMRENDEHPGEWFVLDRSKRAKLGGVGLGLCMYVELEKAAPGTVDMELVRGMARHLARQQLPSGEFQSFFDWDGKHASRRKSTFYPGEAMLGLVRLHQLTGEAEWLEVAARAADFYVHRRWKSLGIRVYVPPDAWLIQALEELDRVDPDPARRRYAFSIADAIARNKLMDEASAPRDLLGADLSGLSKLPNAATSGAYGEALSAAARLEARHSPGSTRYLDSAMKNADFQLRNQFVPANSYFLTNPERALGGFRKSPDAHEIRNDYVQHNLSGLFGLLDLLDPEAPDIGAVVKGGE